MGSSGSHPSMELCPFTHFRHPWNGIRSIFLEKNLEFRTPASIQRYHVTQAQFVSVSAHMSRE